MFMKNPNGYGSIFKLSGNRRKPYCVRLACKYTSDGQKLTEHRPVLGYYRTKAEALQALAEYNKSPYDLSNKATFADIFKLWIDTKKISEKTVKAYKIAFNKCQEIHNVPISDLRLQHYQTIVNRYTDQSCTTITALLTVIHNVSKYALKYDMISKDYSEFIESSHAAVKDIHKPFSEDEIEMLWEQQQSELRDITLILLYSGFRVNELLEMTSENIDLNELTFKGGNKTKAGKNRLVPMHSRIIPLVTKYKDGFKMNYNSYYKLLKKSGHIPHDTRHTFISRLQTAAADHICIQRLVGHTSDNITDNVYTHKDIDELRRTVELLK